MIITWDEPKRLQNIKKHGLDFADFEKGFDLHAAIVAGASDGRVKLIGVFQGELIVAAIATHLGTEALALISLRRASKKERRLYVG